MKLAIWQALLRDDSGQDLMEYVLVSAVVSLGAVAAMNSLAVAISSTLSMVTSDVNSLIPRRH
jgi:pilus assembly protein Flp/PilA